MSKYKNEWETIVSSMLTNHNDRWKINFQERTIKKVSFSQENVQKTIQNFYTVIRSIFYILMILKFKT